MSGQNIAQEGREQFAGDFVLENMELGSDKGFNHVAKVWLDKCMTFEQAREKVAEDQRKIEDFRDPLSGWDVVAHDNRIGFVRLADGREYTPTNHALNLMCQVGRGMSTWAVRSLNEPIPHATKKDDDGNPIVISGGERTLADYECLRDYIKLHLFNDDRVKQEKPRLWRTWNDGTLRALLSEQYTIVNNTWYMDVLAKAIPGGMVSHWKGDADSIYANILIPDTIRQESDSDFGGMLSVGNSEIGTRRISSLPSVFRAICMNGCIWDQESGKALNKVHRGTVDFDSLAAQIIDNLQAQIPLLPQGIQRVLGLRAYGCGDTPMPKMVAQAAMDFSFSKRQVASIFDGWHEENRVLGYKEAQTAYGLQGAITRAGQKFDNDSWLRFDTVAGTIANMSRDDWDRFRNRADNLSDKQVASRLGELVAV